MRTINDWILVKPLDEPDANGENRIISIKPNVVIKWAEVIQISDEVLEDEEKEVQYQVGDVVVFYEKTGIPVTLHGETYNFMKWDGMLAVDDEYVIGEKEDVGDTE